MKNEITIPKALLGILLFGGIAVPCLVLFYLALHDLIDSLIHLPIVIEFRRGAMYGLGAGIVTLSVFLGFIVLLFHRRISVKAENRMGKGIVVGLVLTFMFPILAGFVIPKFIEDENYHRCEKAEPKYSWPIFRTHIYTDSQQDCDQLIREKIKNNEY
ncbi:hypothetical protein [Vibrio gazogenes]|uniref:DUF1240 domain-containing protein n=1 Tax=Vibrio gazogenes DSM 21264 = NBRC 103151 TaxID=1123492 RepID=A0A1M5B805_VIBGA|nr:hypothetical protein [Vibrio gazogenes]USP14095.1 hypothetical protein MKS89_01760 [Vibrio gazogenes]SHF38609.1 hypothetical protein SAMN02745781_02127 [Vibrio gazogenes DSM 21264] [Vibrio gazogenes DSM 21264 = NBRC 103151]SJN53610.1 hypothetical protein BQ6471_00543 [Vibrio gazogenes]